MATNAINTSDLKVKGYYSLYRFKIKLSSLVKMFYTCTYKFKACTVTKQRK